MSDNPWVRVTDTSTGYHYSVRQSTADANPGAYRVLKQDAVDHNGDPLPPDFADSPASGQGSAASGQPKSGSADTSTKGS